MFISTLQWRALQSKRNANCFIVQNIFTASHTRLLIMVLTDEREWFPISFHMSRPVKNPTVKKVKMPVYLVLRQMDSYVKILLAILIFCRNIITKNKFKEKPHLLAM